MESRFGPLGLRQEYTYDEVMRAISEQPLKLDYPKRVGLRTFGDIFLTTLLTMAWLTKASLQKVAFIMICQGSLQHDQMSILMPGLTMELEVEVEVDQVEGMVAMAKDLATHSEDYQ